MLDINSRGLVNGLIYAVDLDHPISDAAVESVAHNVLAQRVYSDPVSSMYAAAEAALDEGEQLADDPAANRRAHDFLRRLLRALDERRPWPQPHYEQLDVVEGQPLMTAPVIGHVDLTPVELRDRLSRGFTRLPDGRRALILRLHTGQVVGFFVPSSPGSPVEVRSSDEPDRARADLRQLTGLEVTPA